MSTRFLQQRTLLACAIGALTLGACSGGGGSKPSVPKSANADGHYLFVSVPDYYFGTQPVGGTRTEELEIQNRGADRYPLEAVIIRGDDADDFRLPIYDEIVLEPSQAIRVPITFAPLDDGRKMARMDVDYEVITVAGDDASALEASYYQANDLALDGELAASGQLYQDYLDSEPVTANRQRAATRVPIVQEAEQYGDGEDSKRYLEALEARDKDNPALALLSLDALMLTDPDSYLADDAQYLKGYIALMDLDDPATALREFQTLIERFPDSTYYDTALYGEAIAQERLGNDRVAAELYTQLRKRHTGVEALGVRLPKDDLVSRLWFGRADAALEALSIG